MFLNGFKDFFQSCFLDFEIFFTFLWLEIQFNENFRQRIFFLKFFLNFEIFLIFNFQARNQPAF